jgi:hypothetical protein
MSHPVTRELLDNAYTYKSFRKMTDEVYIEGDKQCEGQSVALFEYAKLNVHRMNRLDKTIVINEELKKEIAGLERKLIWLVIAETWCGDAAQHVPVFAKMAELSDNIELKYILRDENPDVMNLYLTNGGKAIPILICLDAETMSELGRWGPRPAPTQKLAKELASNPDVTKEEKNKKVILWYAEDKTKTIQSEFLNLINIWKK